MINGQFVKKDGNVNLDLDEIKKHALERVQGILRKGKGKTKLVF
jgi:hypothetical protein